MSEQYRVSVIFEGRDELSNVTRRVTDNMAEVAKAGSRFRDVLGDIGRVAAGTIAGLIGFSVLSEIRQFVIDATRAFVEFERESVKLAALASEAGENVSHLAQVFRVAAAAASREYAVSANEAIRALEALVKAGLSGSDAMAALGEVIKLAKIENVDYAAASASVVQVMAQFGLTGHEAARAVDVLVNASRAGIGSAVDFANGLANVGATAKALGMSIEDATTWLVILERRFGSAQEAGTHLNRFLLDLIEIARKLGVAITDTTGEMRDANLIILDVIATVKNSNMSFAELQERLTGVDMRALKALFTFAQMTENIEELQEAISRAGTATDAFNQYMETTAGKMEQMQAHVDRLQRQIGEGFGAIATMIGSVVLPAIDFVVGAFVVDFATAMNNAAYQLQGYLQMWMAVGKYTAEEAADIIAYNIEIGRITVEEGLKIAEALGVTSKYLEDVAMKTEKAKNTVAELGEEFAKTAAQIENANKVIKLLSRSFGVNEQRVAELISSVLGLNVVYDENAELVEKLTKELAISEAEARKLIDTLKAESQAHDAVGSSVAAHSQTYDQLIAQVQRGITELLNFGKVTGPLTNALNTVTSALNEMRTGVSSLGPVFSEALIYFTELNNKMATLEVQMRTLRSAQDVASFGLSYYNTILSVNRALVADEIALINQEIERRRQQIAELERLAKYGGLNQSVARSGIEALKKEIEQLEARKKELESSIKLTAEQIASQERLQAIQSALSFTTQQLSLMQTALQLAMMGAGSTAEAFMNVTIGLTEALMDGVVTEEEMKNTLAALGVEFDETGKPVLNLRGFLEKFREEVLTNINKVNEFRNTLQQLDGTTIHTYHYHHVITVTEGTSSRGSDETLGAGNIRAMQHGAWYTPEGLAYLHRGEMVLPRDVAEFFRRGGMRPVNVNVSINVTGQTDPEQLAQVISREIARRLRMV